MLDPFALPFMQRAALEIVMLAPIAGLLGAQIVLRRLSFFTHGVGTASFPGLVIAGPAGVPPALAALAVGGGFAGILEYLSRRRGVSHDAGTALLLVAALAIGVVLASDVFATGAGVDRLLFGSLLAIGTDELVITSIALALVVGATVRFRRSWISRGFDDAADVHGEPRAVLADRFLLGVVTVAAVVALDAVGALLVSAILVIPAATARLFARSVTQLEIGGGSLAAVQGIAGLAVAYEIDAPPGAVVAVLGGACFVLAALARAGIARRLDLDSAA